MYPIAFAGMYLILINVYPILYFPVLTVKNPQVSCKIVINLFSKGKFLYNLEVINIFSRSHFT